MIVVVNLCVCVCVNILVYYASIIYLYRIMVTEMIVTETRLAVLCTLLRKVQKEKTLSSTMARHF